MHVFILRITATIMCFASVSLVVPTEVFAGSETALLKKNLEEVLRDLSRVGVLGAVMAIEIPGHEQLFMASGVVSKKNDNPMDVSRLFQIGSQTKMFTAAAILLLAQEGKLTLTDPVEKYVQGLTGSPGVTVQQLLTHTSGIGDSITLFDPPAVRPDYHVSIKDHLLLGRVSGKQFEAGTEWGYNNLGYVVLGKIVETASGSRLDEYVRSRLLNPLGMHSTWLGALETYPEERMARGYFPDEKTGELIDSTMPDLSWASSAGDMVSSLEDMLSWSNALLDSKNPIGLNIDDFRRITVPTGSPGNMKYYGLGIMGRNVNGLELWGHGGNIHGYVSLTLVDPETGIIVVLMTSLDDYQDALLPTLESVVSMAFRMSLLISQIDKG